MSIQVKFLGCASDVQPHRTIILSCLSFTQNIKFLSFKQSNLSLGNSHSGHTQYIVILLHSGCRTVVVTQWLSHSSCCIVVITQWSCQERLEKSLPMVRPSSANFFSNWSRCKAFTASKPEVGSSNIITGGLFNISSPMASLFI